MVIYDNEILEEKELNILRKAIDVAEKMAAKNVVLSPEVKNIIEIVESFLKDNDLICYGGTAIKIGRAHV